MIMIDEAQKVSNIGETLKLIADSIKSVQITSKTKTIRVRIAAEPDFNPLTDIDITSLQFGEAETVNYGRGGKVLKSEKAGDDLIVPFDGAGNHFPDDEFAAKMIGKTSSGKLLFGYARLPWVNFIEPILFPRMPKITVNDYGFEFNIEIQNFGQIASQVANLNVAFLRDGKEIDVASGKVPVLKPYEKSTIKLTCGHLFGKGIEYLFKVTVKNRDVKPVILFGRLTPFTLK